MRLQRRLRIINRGSVTRTATSREAELIMIASTEYHRSPWQVGCNCHTETDTNSGGEDAHGDSNQDGMNKIVEEIIKWYGRWAQ
jgi:hypothetical protein